MYYFTFIPKIIESRPLQIIWLILYIYRERRQRERERKSYWLIMMHKMKFATYKSHYVVALFLLASITAALYLTTTTQNRGILRQQESKKQRHHPPPPPPPPPRQPLHNEDREKTTYEQSVVNDTKPSCDLFSGRWVFDNASNAMYGDEQCSFMLGDYACEKYGRKDLRYRNWRWQPHHCNIPR